MLYTVSHVRISSQAGKHSFWASSPSMPDMHPFSISYSSTRPEPTPSTSATRASAVPTHPFARLRQQMSRHPLQLRRNASSADNTTPIIVETDQAPSSELDPALSDGLAFCTR